jgi:hypothetical protein
VHPERHPERLRCRPGGPPETVVWHDEPALLLTIVLPALEREPLFHLADEETPEGYTISAVFGEQGAGVAGWLRQYKPR